MGNWFLVLVVVALLSGCVGPRAAEIQAPSGFPPEQDFPDNATAATPESAIPQNVTFSGHVRISDPVVGTWGTCPFAFFDGWSGDGGGIAGDSFRFEEDYTGWIFAFDIDGMVAQFFDKAGPLGGLEESGAVPAGADHVYACSREASDSDYVLTFTNATAAP